jgi:hypothetical protein
MIIALGAVKFRHRNSLRNQRNKFFMTFPWENTKPRMPWEPLPPALIKNPLTGLWPGQQHPLDIPDFLRRVPK